jgi:anti-sigma-K factor RskA
MSNVEQESPRDLAAAYALGALPPEEARAFEAVLAADPEARREVEEYREVAALLALAGEGAAEPSASLRRRVLASAPRVTTPVEPVASRTRRMPVAVWGALAASILIAAALFVSRQHISRQLAERDVLVTQRDSALALRSSELAAREALLNTLLAPGVEVYRLSASGDPEPGIQLFWDRQRNVALVHAYGLKPPAAGRAYQLWFIRDGKPVPSVTFSPEQTGRALVPQVSVPADGVVSAAAITEEPIGGSPQPTSPILMVGALGKS